MSQYQDNFTDTNFISNLNLNFNCEWIDNEDSPHRKTDRSYRSEIQGIQCLSSSNKYFVEINGAELQINQIQNFNENQQTKNDEHQLNQSLKINDDSFCKSRNATILGQQLQFLNDSQHQHQNSYILSNKEIENVLSQENHQNMLRDQMEGNCITNEHNEKLLSRSGQLGFIHQESVKEIKINSQQNIISKQSQYNIQPKRIIQFSQQPSHLSQQQKHDISSTHQSDPSITIIENSFVSKLYQDITSIQQSNILKSMATYLENNEYSYKPFYLILEEIFKATKIIADKSNQNFLMYVDYFKEKYKLFQKYLSELTNQKIEKVYQNLKNKQINDLVYIDTKVVLRDIHEKNVKKAKLYKQFFKYFTEIYKDLKDTVKKIKQQRLEQQKSISMKIDQIKQLQTDLTNIIEYRFNCEKNRSSQNMFESFKKIFKVQNRYIFKDQYLQMKFIIEKEQYYLERLKSLRIESIKYLNSVFLTDQIYMAMKLKENLINYTQAFIDFKKKQSEIYEQTEKQQICTQNIEKKKDILQFQKISQQLKIQLGRILLSCLPKKLNSELGLQQNLTLTITSERLLQQINDHFQNQVFMNNIELDRSLIFFKNKGKWIPKNQNKLTKTNTNDHTPAQIIIVLSVNKYLHMQIDQKIATMKLNEIKISKKGKQMIIVDKGKGLVGYLVNSGNQLGRIEFQTSQEANIFSQKLRQLIQTK